MKPPRVLGTRDFWFGISLAAIALVSVWLFLQNRSLIQSNQEEVARLCDTTTALDLSLVVPFLAETRDALEFLPPGPERRRAQRIEQNLEVAHAELSDTTLCAQVR